MRELPILKNGAMVVASPAEYTVHTPSGPTDACEIHASALVNLMSFMGAHANATPAEPGAECANCVNEARK